MSKLAQAKAKHETGVRALERLQLERADAKTTPERRDELRLEIPKLVAELREINELILTLEGLA